MLIQKTFINKLKDFGLKTEGKFLKGIACTQLTVRGGNFYLKDGFDQEIFLGKSCNVDWIGRWGNASSRFGQGQAAGDNTQKADVSGWATDYFKINLDPNEKKYPSLGIYYNAQSPSLETQLIAMTHGGSILKMDMGGIKPSSQKLLNIQRWLKKQNLTAQDIEKSYLLVTNLNPTGIIDYEIITSV